MMYTIILTPSAEEDILHFTAREQRIIANAVDTFLQVEPVTETRRRKRLDANPIATWELRVDVYRVFYVVESQYVVKVIAVGYKEHNTLYIRGRKVEL